MKTYKKPKAHNLGRTGEDVAAAYLRGKKYRVVLRNYRTKYGEIDIIAKDLQGTLVFVEVKTLSGNLDPANNLLPEDNLSSWKLYKLQRICRFFANAYPAMANVNGWRIDLVSVIFEPKARKVRHYKNL